MSAGETHRLLEEDDVPSRRLWLVAGVAVVVTAVSVAVAAALLRGWSPARASRGDQPTLGDQSGPVERSLILTTERGIDERAEQRRSLDQYRVIDPVQGIAQIPIDVAMQLVADPEFRRRAEESAAPSGVRAK